MLFALNCKDKPDHLQIRLDARPDHVSFLEDLNARGSLAFAVPYLGEDGKPCGSIVVIEVATRAVAEVSAAIDP